MCCHLSKLALGLNGVSMCSVFRSHPSPLCYPFLTRLPGGVGKKFGDRHHHRKCACHTGWTLQQCQSPRCFKSGALSTANGQKRDIIRLGGVCQGTSKFWWSHSQNAFCQTILPSCSMTTSVVGCLKGSKQWWPTWRPAPMKRHTLVIFRQQGRLKRKRWWIHLIARLLIVQASLRWWASSPYESWKAPSPHQDPCCMGSTPGRRECWQRRRCWEGRPQWHWRCNQGIHCMPCQSSEGCSAGGETWLSLQEPRALCLRLPIGEGIQDGLTFKPKGGDSAKEGILDPSGKGDHTEGTPRQDAQGIKGHMQTPFLNPNPFNWWYGIENVARVRVNRESCMAVLENGTQINTIMPGLIKTIH